MMCNFTLHLGISWYDILYFYSCVIKKQSLIKNMTIKWGVINWFIDLCSWWISSTFLMKDWVCFSFYIWQQQKIKVCWNAKGRAYMDTKNFSKNCLEETFQIYVKYASDWVKKGNEKITLLIVNNLITIKLIFMLKL